MIKKTAMLAIALLALTAAGWNLSVTTEASYSGQDSKSSSTTRKAPPVNRGDGPAQKEIPIAPRPSDPTAQQSGRVFILIELKEEPTTRVYAATLGKSNLPKAEARAEATFAARQQLALINRSQSTLAARLASPDIDAKELYRVQRVLNAIAVEVDAAKVELIRRLPNVKDVQPLEEEFIGNATSVPFLGTPQLWENTLGLPAGVTGAGIKVGIIDTGIDYQHANFGGTGLLADYQANDRTLAPDAFFPSVKVVGGMDFVGDAYNGNNTPVPDNDPMDCNGHGSHVAGTAAGLGVRTDSTTFPGPYDTSVPFSSLRIGPGVAPQALLYALRVFGCGGSTRVTAQAIDWAVDPDGNGDFSDHLDVINMSLGSNYGTLTNTSTVASENAALAGVIVVAASGNAGDTYFITSAPANASSAISVAATNDSRASGTVLTINSPAAIAGNYAAGAGVFTPAPPAPSGQTANVVLVDDGSTAGTGGTITDGCQTPFVNAAAVSGNFALIDRGVCGFINKVANAQAAGATGVIIVNNLAGDPVPINMSGSGFTITIPSVFISKTDGDAIKAQLALGTVNVTFGTALASDTIASFSSRGPRIDSPNRLKPDIAAPGVSIVSAQTGVTCTPGGGCIRSDATGFLAGSQSLTISGTSMATPHIAGVMALLRQLHPDWGVEELKALAMDTALNDVTLGAGGGGPKFGPGRVGAGRVDPAKAATAEVIAYNADEPGQVSLSFINEIAGAISQIKKIKVVNKGTTSQTFDLAFNTVVDAPGVSFSLPGGSSVTIPGGETVELMVQMSASPNMMKHTRDATVAATQAAPGALASLGNLNRHWLTEEGAYLNFSQSGNLKLRLPLYASARPASMMSAADTITTGGAGSGSTTLALTGMDICSGTLGAGPVCTGTFPNDWVSLVSPFELQIVSPRDTAFPAFADIQYVGTAYDATNNLILFGVASHGDWSTPTQVAYNILVDFNEDGTYDRILFNSNPGTMASSLFGNVANGQDPFVCAVLNTTTNGVNIGGAGLYVNRQNSSLIDSALFNNNVMILSATPAQLGLLSGDTTFRYRVVTCFGSSPLCGQFGGALDSAPGPFFWNYNAQGLNFSGTHLAQDLNGATLPVAWNLANATINGSLGALLLHHLNASGKRAEVTLLEGAQQTDLSITKMVSTSTPTPGSNVTFTLTVTNNGPNAATGVVVTDLLPSGLTYVSDNGGGAYNSASGLWTVGSLAVSASASLQIVATVDTSDAVENVAQITAATPLDPDSSDNTARVTVTPVRQADLMVTETSSPAMVNPGQNVTFTITVKNLGDDTAFNVVVNESFPAFAALNPSSFTASSGVYTPATGMWKIASLSKGSSATLAITVAAPDACGAFTNQSTASSATSDPASVNNTASASTTVKDVTPPTIACPPNQVVATVGASSSVVVNYPNPTVNDNCPGATFVCAPPSGSTFPTGTTTVTCTATDGGGNTATCSFIVTVYDICLQDDSTGATLLFNSQTGDYRLCCGGAAITGRGTVSRRGNTVTLTHNTTSRRLQASVDTSNRKGNASYQSPPGILACSITDRDTGNNTCACP